MSIACRYDEYKNGRVLSSFVGSTTKQKSNGNKRRLSAALIADPRASQLQLQLQPKLRHQLAILILQMALFSYLSVCLSLLQIYSSLCTLKLA